MIYFASGMMNIFKKVLLAGIVLSIGSVMSCKKTDDSANSTDSKKEVPESLHISFKTPDWERNIDCTHLDLPAMSTIAGVYFVSASSASLTGSTFVFSYPEDSSAIVASGNLKKYEIVEYAKNNKPFQFSQKLPTTVGSSDRLISKAGFSTDEFVDVTQIKYVGSTAAEALFQVKCKYSMKAYLVSDTSQKKLITGTFHFKIKTTRK